MQNDLVSNGFITLTNTQGRRVFIRPEEIAMVTADDQKNNNCWVSIKGDSRGFQVIDKAQDVMAKITGNKEIKL